LFGYIAVHRLNLWRAKRDEYLRDYTIFCDSFSYAINQIKTRSTALNLIILGEFPKHDEAVAKFISHLKGKRLNRFQENWEKYKYEYQKLKNVHIIFAATSNLLPYAEEPKNEEDLLKHAEMEYEYILGLLHGILQTSKLKTWL
jgi:hypothetical protein